MKSEKIPETKFDLNSFVLDPKNIIFERDKIGKKISLGKGDSGKVYKATWNNLPIAVKELALEEKSKELKQKFIKECTGLAQMFSGNKFPNVLKLYGYYTEPNFALVYEYMPNGDLINLLQSDNILDWALKIKIAQGIVKGISCLHNLGILHKNIKSSNILLGENLTTKICGNEPTQIISTSSIYKGSFERTAFLAPELYQSSEVKHTIQSDVYALGILLWEIASQKRPFTDVASIPFWVTIGGREEIPVETPKEFAEIIKECWSQNPMNRPSAEEILLKLDKIMIKDEPENLKSGSKLYIASLNDENPENDPKDQIPEHHEIEKKQKLEINSSFSFNININEVVFYKNTKGKKEILGKGGFGKVYEASWNNYHVAVKMSTLKSSKISKKEKENFEKEGEIMAKMCNNLPSPNILKLYGYSTEPRCVMILELCPLGSLYKMLRIHKNLHLSWQMRIKIAIGITKGISFLHNLGIIHKDIKSLNVLLDQNFIPKICDFGISQIRNQTKSYFPSFIYCKKKSPHEKNRKEYIDYLDVINHINSIDNTDPNEQYPHQVTEDTDLMDKRPIGTTPFMAPELFSQKPVVYSTQSDIYALGMLFWEIAAREWPFVNVNKTDIPYLIQQGIREQIPSDCPKPFAEIIKDCWEKDPKKRPSADDILSKLKKIKIPMPNFFEDRYLLSHFNKLRREIQRKETKHEDIMMNPGRFNIIFSALKDGNLELLKNLFEQMKFNKEDRDADENTPLHVAARFGHLKIVKYLIKRINCEKEVKNNSHMTPLHEAALCNRLEVVKYLIEEAECDQETNDNNKNTLLHTLAWNGHLEILKYLTEKTKWNINAKNADGDTPLHRTVHQGNLKIAKYLIEAGCNLEAKNDLGRTPLHLAVIKGYLDIVKVLIEDGRCDKEVKTNNGYTALSIALGRKDLILSQYLTKAPHYTKFNYDEETKDHQRENLHEAAGAGNLEIIKHLLEQAKFNKDEKDNAGATPLIRAAENGHLNVVSYLIQCKCDKTLKNIRGNSALQEATERGHLNMVKYLIEKAECDKEEKNTDGYIPLLGAIRNGHFEIVKYLIENAKCDIKPKESDGWNPLHIAAGNGQLQILKYLIKLGMDKEAKDYQKCTPLNLAAGNQQFEIVKYLIEVVNCDKEAKNSLQSTPLHAAAYYGSLKIVQYLIEHAKCNKEAKDINGCTPLHYATTTSNKLEIIKYLIKQAKCDKEAKDIFGRTPLNFAATFGAPSIIVKYLVEEAGCDKDAKNNYEWTPLQAAEEEGRSEIVQYLKHINNKIITDI